MQYLKVKNSSILMFLSAFLFWSSCFFFFLVKEIKELWGEVSLPQLFYFMHYGWSGTVDLLLVGKLVFFCGVLPSILTGVVLFVFKKYRKDEVLVCPPFFMFLYLVILWFGVDFNIYLSANERYEFYIVLTVFYFLNQWRNWSRFNVFLSLILIFGLVFATVKHIGGERLFLSLGEFEETNFYAQRYVDVGHPVLKESEKRNIIIVFAESFENKFSVIRKGKSLLKVKDDEAVKFADLTEGYAQNWSQSAFFSAFTGVHIHYLSNSLKYAFYDKIKYYGLTDSNQTNRSGEYFDFNTPSIRYLGDVLAENGYTNLFVQGGDLVFSGTNHFLLNHSFNFKNVYDLSDFKDTDDYANKGTWWGVRDATTFDLFKQKITELDKKSPFMAVMFTLDNHAGDNPFYSSNDYPFYFSEQKLGEAVITSLNDFISWFEQQDFYDKTTLVVVGDHRKMGHNAVRGGRIYNAFFNLPERFLEGLNLNRKFNQIDMFPTLLEIAGFELPDRRAGMGVSLFSGKKTLAEEFSYKEQEGIFSKIDRFYHKLWGKEDIFAKPFFLGAGSDWSLPLREKLIAHAGGTVDGNVYTNSLEALEHSFKRGYKYIELDLQKTLDTPPRIFAAHELPQFANFLQDASLALGGKLADVKDRQILGKYTVLDDEKILAFFMAHPDVYLVTDKIDDFKLLAEKFEPIKNRMIVEVFSPEKYKEAQKYGFVYVAYNIKNKADLDIALKNKYSLVTVDLLLARAYEQKLQELRQSGTRVMGYSADVPAVLDFYQGTVDVFYYNGEENLL